MSPSSYDRVLHARLRSEFSACAWSYLWRLNAILTPLWLLPGAVAFGLESLNLPVPGGTLYEVAWFVAAAGPFVALWFAASWFLRAMVREDQVQDAEPYAHWLARERRILFWCGVAAGLAVGSVPIAAARFWIEILPMAAPTPAAQMAVITKAPRVAAFLLWTWLAVVLPAAGYGYYALRSFGERPEVWFSGAFSKFAVFSGRARRKEYWYFTLVMVASLCVLTNLDVVLGTYGEDFGLGVLSGLFAFVVLMPAWAVEVRRLHDIGRSGWWMLLLVLPFVGFVVLTVFAAIDGHAGTNRYGPDPKSEERLAPIP